MNKYKIDRIERANVDRVDATTRDSNYTEKGMGRGRDVRSILKAGCVRSKNGRGPLGMIITPFDKMQTSRLKRARPVNKVIIFVVSALSLALALADLARAEKRSAKRGGRRGEGGDEQEHIMCRKGTCLFRGLLSSHREAVARKAASALTDLIFASRPANHLYR